MKQAVGLAGLGPASCAEPSVSKKRRRERQNHQLHLVAGSAVAGLDSRRFSLSSPLHEFCGKRLHCRHALGA
jgi:hypothetical protein